jgi:carotenoid cleavage dioxygenase-like enzyme
MVGSKYTKSSFAKGVGRFIPLAGGLFSGGLTLYTFRKGANRLRRQLRAQRHLFDDGAIDSIELSNIKTSFVKANKAEQNPQLVELAVIQAMINIAKINDEVSPEKYHFIEQRVARAKIDAPQKLELIGNIESDKSYDVDFDLLSTDREAAQEAYENMEAIVRMDEKTTMAQKIYLNMAAQKLGISN